MFIVRAYSPRSESSCCFGPFKTEEAAESWLASPGTDRYDWDDAEVELVNDPALAGTGQELA